MIRHFETSRLDRIPLSITVTGTFLVWSPDETRLLVSGRGPGRTAGILSVDLKTKRSSLFLSGDPNRFASPVPSRDGRGFYFLQTGPEGAGGSRIMYSGWDPGPPVEIYASPERLIGPIALSPDESQVAVVSMIQDDSTFPGTTTLHVISTGGGTSTAIATLPGAAPLSLSWSSSGREVIAHVAVQLEGPVLHRTAVERWHIPTGGGAPIRNRLPVNDMSYLSFSPDLNHAVYAIRRPNRRSQLWLMADLFTYVDRLSR